jgi:enterochelin esterase-like enzyme
LIEPVTDDARHMFVTFLWRGGDDVHNVVVWSGLVGLELPGNQMARLPGTDVWYLTAKARNDARTVYRLAPNDPLTPLRESPDFRARSAGWRPDPLNARTYLFPKDDEDPEDYAVVTSVVELPGAPPQPWCARQPAERVPAGRVEMFRLRSEVLGNERRVWVYTPPGYTPDGEPHGLLLLFDGWAYQVLVPTPTILDNLIAAGRIPPLVAVLPDSLNQETRSRELPGYPPFADYLAQELVPWVREHYRVTTDPARCVVAGSSFGGLAAAFAGLRHPELFGNVLSQSGSFWWKPDEDEEYEWHARQFALAERVPLRFYVDVGILEATAGRGGPSQVFASRHMRNVLQAKGYEVHYAEFGGGHDYLCWQGTLADGLLALIGDKS